MFDKAALDWLFAISIAVKRGPRPCSAISRHIAAVDVSEKWRVFLASPGILHSFVGKTLGLSSYGCDIFYRDVVPGTQILDIWQPGDPEFDRHPELVETLARDWDV